MQAKLPIWLKGFIGICQGDLIMYVSITTPNFFANLALVLWPIVCFGLYRFRSVVSATILTILAAQLLLPVGTFFKFEMVPQFDRESIPSLCALIGCMIVTGRRIQLGANFGVTEFLLWSSLICPVITSLLNGDAIEVGGTILPGVGIYDGLSAGLSKVIALIPFFLGRQFLRNSKDLQQILETLAFAGFIYSFALLFEIRFSPQLHGWVYGYYPTDFIQEMREDGGFRPMVFMGHGLIACFFLMTTVVASAALWRMNLRILRMNAGGITGYLGVVLVLCKSGAALVYGLVLAPLVRWTKPILQMRAAVFFVVLALFYPAMRMAEVFPTNTIVEIASAVNEPRAHSLEFRFEQEEELLKKASERPWFGWGRFGRSRVFKENWENVGVDTSVTDGRWIITFGQFGVFGFLAEFCLLVVPVLRAAAALKVVKTFREAISLSAIALLIAINLIDLLPNSTLSPWTWLLAGALLGCSEEILAQRRLSTLALHYELAG